VTTAVRTPPAHGTVARHKHHKCPCDPCRDAYNAYQRNYRRQKAYGRWQPYVNAEPARQHLRTLMDAGISYYRVADMIGVNYAYLTGLLYTKGAKQPSKKIRPETATLILAISPNTQVTKQRVDATGTRRRLQALIVMGWPQTTLARMLGRAGGGTLNGLLEADHVYATTADAVSRLYTHLRAAVPENHGVLPLSAKRTRTYSRNHGWHGPLAWDTDTIDDPTAAPDVADIPDPELKRDELAEQRREEIWLLHTACLSDKEIGARVGLAVSTVRAIRDELRTGIKRNRAKKQEAAA
jgi:hypothetical protein